MNKLILILLFNCVSTGDNKNNPLKEKWKLPNQKEKGFLKVKFNSDKENLSIKNYSLRIAKSFPNPKFENSMIGTSPLPFFVESIQYAYPIVHNAEYSHKENLKTNQVSEYELPAGEYYASIDTTLNENFSFNPRESQSLLLKFGYEHDPLWIRSKPTRFGIRFVKFFPGILILAPFTNWGGTYYYRDYKVELTSPTNAIPINK